MNTVTFYSQNDGRHLLYTPFVKETDSTSEKVLMSLGNALVMLCVVVIMTVLLIFFYKYRFYKLINGWLMASSCLLLFLFATVYLQEVMKSFNISLSVFTVCFFLGNFGVLGMMCIHWKGPLRLQQFYLITMSALMALVFIKYLPEWTVWSVLAVISLWDLIAVLAPNGPLRILVETAQERNEPIFPALIYSSGMVYLFATDGAPDEEEDENRTRVPPSASSSEKSTPSTSGLLASSSGSTVRVKRFAPQRNHRADIVTGSLSQEAVRSLNEAPTPANVQIRPSHVRDQDEKGVKLGLGDFIFYSVLVGKASSYFDWNTTVACYVAILVGLCFTLLLLAVFRRALPALPISIFAGLLFYFCTRWIVTPYVSELTRRQLIY
ncbi:Presenilin sel-12 [Parelaphostrongylus tenuis]|uniref:Presenilin sel-12 n=1 Tax=Parelaphostrongylus tenuis TaxID=148309 RepID=A0AAD5LTQ1_PARTN|nr:Presenilin sel-12 [Parelaphostrongylus tenuis]